MLNILEEKVDSPHSQKDNFGRESETMRIQ